MFKKIIVSLATLQSVAYALSFDNSKSDCEEFASLFANTCSSTSSATSFSNTASEEYTCSTMSENQCPGTWSESTGCTFERVLCVTCSVSGGDTYIRVQTNGLPNHCMGSPQIASANPIDWEVLFQADDETVNYTETNQDDLNDLICSIQRTADSHIPSWVEYSRSSEFLIDTASGIFLSGGMVYNGISGEGVDPFYPSDYKGASTEPESVDACMAHPEPMANSLHYHSVSPCIVDDSYSVGKTCNEVDECSEDFLGYAYTPFQSLGQYPVGLSKDGRIIWGPYKDDGTLYDACDVDICNGMEIDGRYGYISTMWHPYILGCFGPGNQIDTIRQECTINPPTCGLTEDEIAVFTQQQSEMSVSDGPSNDNESGGPGGQPGDIPEQCIGLTPDECDALQLTEDNAINMGINALLVIASSLIFA